MDIREGVEDGSITEIEAGLNKALAKTKDKVALESEGLTLNLNYAGKPE